MPLFSADHRQSVLWLLVGAALLTLFYLLAPILSPFVIGAVFAYVCDPIVRWLVRHRVPRTLAVTAVIIGSGVLMGLFLLALIPVFYREISVLLARTPELLEKLNQQVIPYLNDHLGLSIRLEFDYLRDELSRHAQTAQQLLPALLSRAREGGLVLAALAANLVIIPIAMFYLLCEWPRLTQALQDIFPRPWLTRAQRIADDINAVLAQYLRGQLSVMALLGIYYGIGLWLAGLDFALPVAMVTGVLSFIPFIGFGTGLVLALIAALLQAEGLQLLAAVAVVYAIGQIVESYVLTPHLVGERIGLHPLAVIFALMAFGQLFGFIGVLVALPASAALVVGLRELRQAWFNSPLYLGKSGQPEERRG